MEQCILTIVCGALIHLQGVVCSKLLLVMLVATYSRITPPSDCVCHLP